MSRAGGPRGRARAGALIDPPSAAPARVGDPIRPSSLDTSPDAHAAQLSVCDEIREVSLCGIRHRHPQYTEEEARFALFRHLLGHELFVRAWPHAPVLAA